MRRELLLPGLVIAALCALAGTGRAETLAELVEGLGDADSRTRRTSYQELRRRRDPRALPLLTKILPSHDLWGQRYGVLVLEAYPQDRIRRSWRRLLDEDSVYLRFAAGNALVREGEEDALPALVAALGDSRAQLTERLWMIAGLSELAPPQAFAALRRLLAPDQSPRVLEAVFARVHRRRDTAAMVEATRLLADRRPAARMMASAYLLRMGDAKRAPVLATALRAGAPLTHLDLVEEMLATLSRVPALVLDAAVPRLEGSRSAAEKLRWIAFLARFRHEGARDTLRRTLEDEDPEVARAAFDALVLLAGPLDRRTLVPLLSHASTDRRLWAADALRRRDDLAGLPIVTQALARGTDDDRTAAARILGGFRIAASVDPLLRAMEDPHPGVRAEAGLGLERVLRSLFPYRTLDVASTGWRPDVAEDVRTASLVRLRAWWAEARDSEGI